MKKDYPPPGEAGCRSQLWPQATLYDLRMKEPEPRGPLAGTRGAGAVGLACQPCTLCPSSEAVSRLRKGHHPDLPPPLLLGSICPFIRAPSAVPPVTK